MKKYLKHIVLPALMIAALLFSSCLNQNQKNVYNDDNKIASEGDSYTFISKVGKARESSFSFNYEGFTGKYTVLKITAEKETVITLELISEVKRGEFKLCLVNSALEVKTISEGSQDSSLPFTITAGDNRIIMVGSKAKGTVSCSLSGDLIGLNVVPLD